VQIVPVHQVQQPVVDTRTNQARAAELMSQIADFYVPDDLEEKEDLTVLFPVSSDTAGKSAAEMSADEGPIPGGMPAFVPDSPIPNAPKLEKQKEAPAPGGKVSSKDAAESAKLVAAEIEQNKAALKPVYCFPPIDLLKPPARSVADGTLEMKENSKRLNETLASFKIDAHIINVTRGPSVTRYEVELDKGVRLNKLTSCADDIALSLGASGVRIAAVPGGSPWWALRCPTVL